MPSYPPESVDRALKRAFAIMGGPGNMGRALGLRSQTPFAWKRAPATRVLEIERETGISRYELRPDIYGPPPSRAVLRAMMAAQERERVGETRPTPDTSKARRKPGRPPVQLAAE